jgi:hyperosmotically inducible periplasmic protein
MQQTNTRRLRPIAAVAAAMAVAALAACNRPADDSSTRQRADSSVARTERQPQMQEESKSPSANPSANPSATPSTDASKSQRAATDVSDKVKDAAITTAVNAKLAQDKTLSAMRIDVDTVDGKVSLRGAAPDPAARERATTLASAVDGVVSVDNQLTVSGKG